MHGQCDARPTVTFPAAAAGHRHPLTGAKLYCLVMETHVYSLLMVVVSESANGGVEAPNVRFARPNARTIPLPVHPASTNPNPNPISADLTNATYPVNTWGEATSHN